MPLEPVGSGVTTLLLNGTEEYVSEQTGDAQYDITTNTTVNHPADRLDVSAGGSTGYGGAATIFNTGGLGLPKHKISVGISCSGPDGGFEIRYSGVGDLGDSSLQPGDSTRISGTGTGSEYLRIVADGSFDMGYDVYGAIYIREEPSVNTSVTGVTKTE
jgi:hypothetical protein